MIGRNGGTGSCATGGGARLRCEVLTACSRVEFAAGSRRRCRTAQQSRPRHREQARVAIGMSRSNSGLGHRARVFLAERYCRFSGGAKPRQRQRVVGRATPDSARRLPGHRVTDSNLRSEASAGVSADAISDGHAVVRIERAVAIEWLVPLRQGSRAMHTAGARVDDRSPGLCGIRSVRWTRMRRTRRRRQWRRRDGPRPDSSWCSAERVRDQQLRSRRASGRPRARPPICGGLGPVDQPLHDDRRRTCYVVHLPRHRPVPLSRARRGAIEFLLLLRGQPPHDLDLVVDIVRR